MSFQLLLQPQIYNLLLHSQKRQTTFEGNLMPPPPARHLENVNSDKYLTRLCCWKNYGFLFYITNLNFSTIIIPLVRSYLYLIKNLHSAVAIITHNYPSITKICCRQWKDELSSLTTFTSKLCNKLSTQFKYLNSVIE